MLFRSEENNEQVRALFALFTPQLGMVIRSRPTSEALSTLTSTTTTPYLIWNNKTRAELKDYIDAHLSGTMEWTPNEYTLFRFPSLENELVICGVYVRIFNEQIRTCAPLPDPLLFLRAAFKRNDVTGEHARQRALAIANVFEQYDVATTVCNDSDLLQGLFDMLEEAPQDAAVQENILRCVKRLISVAACVEIIAKSKVLSKLLILLHPAEFLPQVVPLAQALFSVTTGLQQGILRGGLLYLLNHFVNGSELEVRVLVAQLIAKMSTTPGIGPKVSLTMSKFFPLAIIDALKMDPRGAVMVLDSTAETPELIWNPVMKKDVGTFIAKMTKAFHAKQLTDPTVKWQVPDSFTYKYKDLENELCVGGVFIRVLNKNPTTPLNNPNTFTDGLMSKYCEAVKGRDKQMMDLLAKTAAVFYTNQPQNLDYVASSGHLSKLVGMLQSAPSESLFVLLQVVVTNKECKERLIDDNAVQLVAMNVSKSPKDSQLVADVLRSMTENVECKGVLCFVPRLCNEEVQAALFAVLDGTLDKQIGQSAPEVKALIVDALQNAIQDTAHGDELEQRLNEHPSWQKYSRQKHVLYLSGASSIAGYIAGPTSSGAVGLLTAAEDASVHRPDLPPELE